MPRVFNYPTVAVQRRKRLRKEMIRRLTRSGKMGDYPGPWRWKYGQLVDVIGQVICGQATGRDPDPHPPKAKKGGRWGSQPEPAKVVVQPVRAVTGTPAWGFTPIF